MLGEFLAVVKRHRVTLVGGKRRKQVFDLLPRPRGCAILELGGQQVTTLAVHERHQAAALAVADDGVSLEVTQPLPPVRRGGATFDAHLTGNSPSAWRLLGLAAATEKRLPVLRVLVLLDPGVDGLGRDVKTNIPRLSELQTPGNLVRRPLLRQMPADGGIQLG